MAQKYKTQCACGVKFEFGSDPTFIADCYCKDCPCGAMTTFFGVPKHDFTLISGCSVFPFLVAQRTGSKSAKIGLVPGKDFDAGKPDTDFAKRIPA